MNTAGTEHGGTAIGNVDISLLFTKDEAKEVRNFIELFLGLDPGLSEEEKQTQLSERSSISKPAAKKLITLLDLMDKEDAQ